MEGENSTNIKVFVGVMIVVLAIIAFFILNPLVIINAGHRGVVLTGGAVSDIIMSEGFGWRTPLIQSVKEVDVRVQNETVDASAASKDLQTVTTKLALNYHLDADKVNRLWQSVGSDYKVRIIDPAIQEAIKSATAKYTAEELITKRPQVKDDAKIALTERLAKEYIIVDELSIVNFDFSGSFNDAIENKVTNEQNALAAKNLLEQKKYEADQTIVSAKATAEAIKIQAQAITSQGGADYVKLQWIKAWEAGGAKVPNFITSDKAGGFIMNMNQ